MIPVLPLPPEDSQPGGGPAGGGDVAGAGPGAGPAGALGGARTDVLPGSRTTDRRGGDRVGGDRVGGNRGGNIMNLGDLLRGSTTGGGGIFPTGGRGGR